MKANTILLIAIVCLSAFSAIPQFVAAAIGFLIGILVKINFPILKGSLKR